MPMSGPMGYAEMPDEIRKNCAAEDICGVFAENVWWWFDKKARDLHLVAGKKGTTPDQTEQSIAKVLRAEQVRNVIVHEGLESLSIDFSEWSVEFEELILPDTARTIPKIKGEFRKMKVPPTVESMDLTNLFVWGGGHWDPVTYAVKRLILPSGIVFERVEEDDGYPGYGRLPTCEPIRYWDEIVIYGEERIRNLSSWIDAQIFYKEFTIYYPKAWDEGKEGSYADEILAHIRALNPETPRFGMAPAEWDPFTEEEYQYIREHLVPYEAE